MKVTRISFLFLILCLITALVACGSDAEGASKTSQTSTTPVSSITTIPSITTEPAVTESAQVTTENTPTTDITLPDIDDTNGLLWYECNEEEGASVLKSSLTQPRDSILFTGTHRPSSGYDGTSCLYFSEGEGIKLNNTFTSFSQITDSTFLHPATQAISVSFYILPDSFSGSQMLFEYGSMYRGFAIALIENELITSITAASAPDADGSQTMLDSYALPDTAPEGFIHILFTYDGTLDGGTATLYVNCQRVSKKSNVGSYLPQVLDASGVATSDHGTNSLLINGAYYQGLFDDLRIYKIGMTPLPTLEDGAVYLQSAAAKNHYIKTVGESLRVTSMVEPAHRGILLETGLADERGYSLRATGTGRYIAYTDGKLTLCEISTDADKKSATFYLENALATPNWADDASLFKSFRLMDTAEYLTNRNGMLVLTDGSAPLDATFKLTGDQRAVTEGVRGVVYYPSYALNAPQFWKWYDHAIIERDMGYAKKLGFNAFRIWVSYEYWLEDPEHFEYAYNDFLALADTYGIKVMVSLFEGCGLAEEGYFSENVWSRDYTKAWSITSPCKEVYTDESRWNEPKAFVTWFFSQYKNDERHMAIEIYNEPWGNREPLAKYLSEYAITVQGSVPITFGTAPAGGYNVVYSVEAGADMIHYHDNFPGSTQLFENNAKTRIEQGRLANLPVYCTEVQWVGGPASVNYPLYRNLAPTVNTLIKTKVWAPFYWTLMMHPCYLDSYRNNYRMKNGIVQEDGSYYSLGNAEAIAPEADLSDATVNDHNPYDDKSYTYRYLFSDDFSDKNAYKWTVKSGTFTAENSSYAGQGIALANATDFADFSATFSVSFNESAGFIFRAKDENNYYLAAVSKSAYALYKVVNGERILLAEKTPEDAGNAFTVTVYAKGSELRVSANCTDCTVIDETFQRGAIGFFSDASATFDALTVTFLPS